MMTNIVSLRRHATQPSLCAVPALINLFATRRRDRHDAFWLKENAELASVLVATGLRPGAGDVQPYAAIGRGLLNELQFFPQYYRMMLGFALDLAALGVPDVPVAAMATHVVNEGLAGAEVSDIHRAEARLLLVRAGVDVAADDGLDARMARFTRQSATFCLPNRRAAYDLTHAVFYAADYGRVPLLPDADRRLSLIHTGMVAWLDGNLDLLAEVTVALRLGGDIVPGLWADAVARAAGRVDYAPGSAEGPFDDDYHQVLVLNWALAAAGGQPFAGDVPAAARIMRQSPRQSVALRELSVQLLDLADARTSDWDRMRWRIWPRLSEPARACISAIEGWAEFEGFFAGFSRAGQRARAA